MSRKPITDPTPRRELLQLADDYSPTAHPIDGMYISEKLDGTRCFWDGGVTRGMDTKDVPWAGVLDPKSQKRKAKIKPKSTGLWSRYGNPIIAPETFLNQLPCIPLDGELWAGRGQYQLCRSIVGGDSPDPRFDRIEYAVYSTPTLEQLFRPGLIKNSQMYCEIGADVLKWYLRQADLKFGKDFQYLKFGNFNAELLFLDEMIPSEGSPVYLHRQTKLPDNQEAAERALESAFQAVLELGAEGLIIRDGNETWVPKRHGGLLKYKPMHDAEATIVGFRAGREGKIGQVLGKIGTLIVEHKGPKGKVKFELGSGLTMDQREFVTSEQSKIAREMPETEMPSFVKTSKHFRVGDKVTFLYREYTDDGIPKEGRFLRKREKNSDRRPRRKS